MGGYGGASGKKKDRYYKDSHGYKVTEKSSIIATEYYIGLGMYVVFLHQDDVKRPDLLVDYKLLVEVKGIISLNPGQISKQIKHANSQIESEHSRHPEDERLPAKIVLLSLHESFEVGFHAISEGYKEAKRKGQVHFQVEFWFNGEIRVLDEEANIMAVRGCGFCSYAIRYHGEPEGTEPVEYVFCRLDKWRELEAGTLTADWLEWEHEEFFSTQIVACGATRSRFSTTT